MKTDVELDARIEELVRQMYLLSIPIELKLAGKDMPELREELENV